MTRWAGARLLASMLVSVSALAACSGTATSGIVPISAPMPDLSRPTVQGGTLTRADYSGKVVVVNVWGAWCVPCQDEAPILESAYRKVAPQGVEFIGVDSRDDPASAKAFIARYGLSYPSVPDPFGRIAYELHVLYPPWTFVAGRQGQLLYEHPGQISQSQLDEMLARAGVSLPAGSTT